MNLNNQIDKLLYVFLRQADLSIDRARWTSWDELAQFYQGKLQPKQVAQILESLPQREPVWRSIFSRKEFSRNSPAFNTMHATLLIYQELLDQPTPTEMQVGSCSMWIKYLAYSILEPHLSRSDQCRFREVDHYHQSSFGQKTPIGEFVDLNSLLQPTPYVS